MQIHLLLIVTILTKIASNISIYKSEQCDVKVESCRENLELCDKLCIENECVIRAVVILPNDTSAGAVITLSSVCIKCFSFTHIYIFFRCKINQKINSRSVQ